jgi:hypothetical protein
VEEILSPRPRATFNKRQKEQARQEKQRAKAERKQQRKRDTQPGAGPPIDFDSDQFGIASDAVSESEIPNNQ